MSLLSLHSLKQAHLKQQKSPAKSTSSTGRRTRTPSKKLAKKRSQSTPDKTNNEQAKEKRPRKSRGTEDSSSAEAVPQVVVVPFTNTSVTVTSEILSARDEFDNFADFKQKLEAYCKETRAEFVVGNSKTIKAANRLVKENWMKIDDKFVYKNIQYMCKYGGKRVSSSSGMRPNQRYTIESPFFC